MDLVVYLHHDAVDPMAESCKDGVDACWRQNVFANIRLSQNPLQL